MANELKINNINILNTTKTPPNASEIKPADENTSKDIQEPIKTAQQESNQTTTDKHVIVYIGSGEYIDFVGHKWHKGDEMTYNDSEYNIRDDLHFMVKYGEMKHTVVTM